MKIPGNLGKIGSVFGLVFGATEKVMRTYEK